MGACLKDLDARIPKITRKTLSSRIIFEFFHFKRFLMNKSPKIVESEIEDTPIKLPLLKDLGARIPKMTMKTFLRLCRF